MSKMFNFVKVGNNFINLEAIASIDTTDIEQLRLVVHYYSGNAETVEGLEAIDLAMKANPFMFEGKRMNFPKHRWIIHNLIAHPLMQILALLGFKQQAMWIHDSTIPRPIGIHNAK